jgi:hypothetical protein
MKRAFPQRHPTPRGLAGEDAESFRVDSDGNGEIRASSTHLDAPGIGAVGAGADSFGRGQAEVLSETPVHEQTMNITQIRVSKYLRYKAYYASTSSI